MNCDWNADRSMRGERASKTACFTYISYCDLITTQIIHWSKILEFAKRWNWPKNSRFSAVRSFDQVEHIGMVQVQFQPRPGTELPIWHCC